MKAFALATLTVTTLGMSLATAAAAFQPFSMTVLIEGSAPITSEIQLAQAVGEFTTVDQAHPTTGAARVVTENGQRYLEFDAAFGTSRGPQVEVILYTGSTIPISIAEADYITLAPLEGFTGAQRYEIPANVNLSNFQSVGIWCRAFNVTFGYATLG